MNLQARAERPFASGAEKGIEKVRISHILDSLGVGGAERLVVALAQAQKSAGHDVAVHALGTGALLEDLRASGVPAVFHPGGTRVQLPCSLWRSLRLGADVVHCHNIRPTVMAAPVARLGGARVVISTRHGLSTRSFRREAKFWLAASFCDHVVAVSESAHRSLASDRWASPRKLVTIQNGSLPLPWEPAPDVDRLAGGLVIVTVGRLVREKDYSSLLRAFAIARREIEDLRLWIVGDGAERAPLEALARELDLGDAVVFAGYRRNIGSWLAKADLFVLSSISEGLPVALLEAMAAGRPVVVTEVGGMPEVVRDAGAGRIVPPSQPDVLAATLVELASRRAELPVLGAAGRRHYEQHFTLERMAARYMALYTASAQSWAS